jgi:hypothetical protein
MPEGAMIQKEFELSDQQAAVSPPQASAARSVKTTAEGQVRRRREGR